MDITNCCFTGHRDLTQEQMYSATLEVTRVAAELYKKGIRSFISGGALGFDLAASVAILRLRRTLPDLTLTIAQPCYEYNSGWSDGDKRSYEDVYRQCDELICVTPSHYFNGCMQIRDKYMVDCSSAIIAWYDGRTEGGTLYTLNYARKSGIEVINVYKDDENR